MSNLTSFMQRIYLDHAATTPVHSEVVRAMEPYYSLYFGNASSVHAYGRDARRGVDYAKTTIATYLGCHPKEILCTSGATESDNLALRGVVGAFRAHAPEQSLHIITTAFEHPAVLETARALEREGVRVTFLAPDHRGIVSSEDVERAITEDTVFVSVMYVNNEVGTIQSIREIGKVVKRANERRSKEKASRRSSPMLGAFERVYLHTDAVQAAAWCQMNVDHLHVDLVSLSAHKVYGPKGAGALYVRTGVPLVPIMRGGAQEYGIRPGTYSVPSIVGMGKAFELLHTSSQSETVARIERLRDECIELLERSIPNVQINGDRQFRIPNNVHVTIPGLDAETALIALDMRGIAISAGSACASGSIEASHVLQAMGLSDEQSRSSLRITLGFGTTDADIRETVQAIIELYHARK